MNLPLTTLTRFPILLLMLLSSAEFVLIISADHDLSMPAEEFHDLDDQLSGPIDHSNIDTGNDVIDHDVDGYDRGSISYKPPDGPNNIMKRFSQIITRQLLKPFQLPRRLSIYQFQPSWIKRGKSKVDSIAVDENNRVSLVNLSNVKKIAALCPPEAEDPQSDDIDLVSDGDESLVVCNTDSTKGVNHDSSYEQQGTDEDEVQAGMILYVLPPGETLDQANVMQGGDNVGTSMSTFHLDDMPHNNNERLQIASPHCILKDINGEVTQYVLRRREFHELGSTDVHRKDFAYHPVAMNKPSHFSEDYTQSDWDGSGFSRGEYNNNENVGTEAAEALSTYDTGYYKFDSGSSNDQQISFRWWSWIDHFNQFFRQGNNQIDGDNQFLYGNSDIIRHSNKKYDRQSRYENLYEKVGKHAFAGGSHGEIWRATRRCPANKIDCVDKKEYIIKRLKIELGYSILEAGLREVYFGELLAREAESSNLVTSYVDHFFRKGNKDQIELWIVFEKAGSSLRSYLYTSVVDGDGGFTVLQHSPFWRRLRNSIRKSKDDMNLALEIIHPSHEATGDEVLSRNRENHTSNTKSHKNFSHGKQQVPEGKLLLKDVMKQILMSAAFLHERGIVHRDIKPSNIMCKILPNPDNDLVQHNIESVNCILGDLSSAWNEYSARNLYATGPSKNEITEEYAPPEVLLQHRASWSPFSVQNPYSYDSWSIGVVALEMLLGTPNVFSVDQRTTVVLTHMLRKEGASLEDIQRALYLAALSQFCIYVPSHGGKSWPLRSGDPMQDAKVVKNSCRLTDFHNALRARDPLGSGFDKSTDLLLHLIWKLLAFNPVDRLSPAQALLHPYFTSSAPEQDEFLNDGLIQSYTLAYYQTPFSGFHNALESQLLDPKVDMDIFLEVSEFYCPKCKKSFVDYNSCHQHTRSRRHALFCNYDRSTLPHCINAHTMLPTHDRYGYCDIQGRRRTIEDFHSVNLFHDNQFYGIFDGHLGNLASKYAASSFYRFVEVKLSNIDTHILSEDWKDQVRSDLEQCFENIHQGILDAVMSSPGGVMDESGTTATILYVTHLAVIIANVGDSRAVISQWQNSGRLSAYQLTIDHVVSSQDEQLLIAERGGSVSKSGGIERLNGILAVSRSLGDINLAQFLSRTPHVLSLTKHEAYQLCDMQIDSKMKHPRPCFIILASDGLWDVMTNQEAVEIVFEAMESVKTNKTGSAYQVAAEWLTQEAYVRGSSDNIGVCVVAID